MLDWKIVVTVFVTLGILIIFLSSSPQLSNFFESLKGKITNIMPEQKVERNVSFFLDADLANIDAQAKDVSIELRTANFTAKLKDVEISSRGQIRILGFGGALSISNKTLVLDGNFKKIELEGTTLTLPQGPLKSEVSFETLAIENLALKELTLPKGRLTINNVETSSDSEIKISSLLGRFEMNASLKVNGKANKISIPAAKIFVG